MNHMKKKLALYLAAVMILTMAAGCSSNANSGTPQNQTDQTVKETTQAATQEKLITEEEAKNIALKKVKGASASDIKKFKLDRDDGRQEYEGEIIYKNKEYDFEINAVTGEIISWEEDSLND